MNCIDRSLIEMFLLGTHSLFHGVLDGVFVVAGDHDGDAATWSLLDLPHHLRQHPTVHLRGRLVRRVDGVRVAQSGRPQALLNTAIRHRRATQDCRNPKAHLTTVSNSGLHDW